MKFLVLIITLLFSLSVLADCCSSVEIEGNCQIETLKENRCTDVEHGSKDHDVCHCSFACSSKIIKKPISISISLLSYISIPFYRYDQGFKAVSLSPDFRPPIA